MASKGIPSKGPAFRPAPPPEGKGKVRVGIVGIGEIGLRHLVKLLPMAEVEIRALCDVRPERMELGLEAARRAGRPKPDLHGGEEGYKELCAREDLDLVLTATPWQWHVPVCLEAMGSGKHAATEVPAAVTLEDCWKLVETSERTGRQCVMLENCCYGRVELLALNMARKGLFGKTIHARGGYLHDLRAIKFSSRGEGSWSQEEILGRDGDPYPTHGLGPVAWCLDLGRGNRMERLVSMSSAPLGLRLYAEERFGASSPEAERDYAQGDVVLTMIRAARGETILLVHDTNSPRPYSRNFLVQGTRGILRKYPVPLIHLEGRTPPGEWEDLAPCMEEFDHPLWKGVPPESREAERERMDTLALSRLVRAFAGGYPPDMDVYDAASWSAVAELSARSIAGGNIPVEFPDFTRGAWRSRPPALDLPPGRARSQPEKEIP